MGSVSIISMAALENRTELYPKIFSPGCQDFGNVCTVHREELGAER